MSPTHRHVDPDAWKIVESESPDPREYTPPPPFSIADALSRNNWSWKTTKEQLWALVDDGKSSISVRYDALRVLGNDPQNEQWRYTSAGPELVFATFLVTGTDEEGEYEESVQLGRRFY